MVQTKQLAVKGLLAAEWVGMAYLLFTLVFMAFVWTRLENVSGMLILRGEYVAATLGAWAIYRWRPCKLTMFLRVIVQMVFLSWWYPDTYELNRVLPRFSELMCLGYVSYFPLMLVIYVYYFFQRYQEFKMATFVIMSSFFAYYIVFDLLPVTGPQFYYLAVGTEKIAAGIFPNLGDWFLTHSERMAAPGWTDGFFYHLLDITHDAGERPTAAFPSSHVGVTTVLMMLALRTKSWKLVGGMLPFYLLMCFSTVYIFAHYLIDALAGLATGIAIYYALCAIYKKMGLR